MKVFSSAAAETDDVGIADNDIDGFLKNLLPSVTREAAQNSNDEAVDRPVKMTFDLFDVQVSDIPDFENYQYIIDRCYEDAVLNSSKKGKEFFENAKKVLSRKSVSVLRISDQGTKGAGGEFKRGGKFYTLVVSKGRTDKDNVYSAGSFGIGKNAAFAGSEIRSVFYSSKFEGHPDFYCMGKGILTSWSGEKGQNMSHKVFFSESSEELVPVHSQADLPDWLRKKDKGLSVSIIAPRVELREGWYHGYVASLISNFFLAIYDGSLEFSLDQGRVVLTAASMYQYFLERQVEDFAEKSGQIDRFLMAKSCVEGLVSNAFSSEVVKVDSLGEFEILICVEEGLPKKVCFVRNGMFITDTLQHFGKHLVRFPNTKDFIAIVRPGKIDDSSSEAIKRMENPEHSELTTSYIADEEEVRVLNKAMLSLEREIRNVIAKHAKLEVSHSVSIDELREFFPGDDSKDPRALAEEDDPFNIVVENKGAKGFKGDRSQRTGGKAGGNGRQGGNKSGKKSRKGPGKREGSFKGSRPSYRSVRVGSGREWRVTFSALPEEGVIELWPEEEPRSGRDSKSIRVVSCESPGALIASDGLSIQIPIQSIVSQSLTIKLDRSVSVIAMRPVLKEADGEI